MNGFYFAKNPFMVFIQNNPEIALHIRDSIMHLIHYPRDCIFECKSIPSAVSPFLFTCHSPSGKKLLLKPAPLSFPLFIFLSGLCQKSFFFNSYTIPSYKAKSNTFRQKLFDMRFTQIILYKSQNYVKIV